MTTQAYLLKNDALKSGRALKQWEEIYGNVDSLRNQLKGEFALVITFKKINGETRELVGTLNQFYITDSEKQKQQPTKTKNHPRNTDPFYDEVQKERRDTHLVVYDVEKKAFRSMLVENIEAVDYSNIRVANYDNPMRAMGNAGMDGSGSFI